VPLPPSLQAWRMIESEVAAQTEAWVRTQFSVNPADYRFGRDTDLFDNGYVDSVGLAELIGFLEEEFGIESPDDLLVSDDFATIDGISRAICRLAAVHAY
jgi:acyl carrier protein